MFRRRVALDARRIANYRDGVDAETARQLVGGAGAHDDRHVVGTRAFERHLKPAAIDSSATSTSVTPPMPSTATSDDDQRCGMLRRFMPVTARDLCEGVGHVDSSVRQMRRSASTIFSRMAVSAGHRPVTRPNTSISDAPTTKVPALRSEHREVILDRHRPRRSRAATRARGPRGRPLNVSNSDSSNTSVENRLRR